MKRSQEFSDPSRPRCLLVISASRCRVVSITAWVLATMILNGSPGHAADEVFNYDEAQVRQYTLPDPLAGSDGLVEDLHRRDRAAALYCGGLDP